MDALVNNAGVDRHGPVEAYPEDVARWIMDTNFWGTFRMTCAVAPAMREQGSGVIVNMSSVQGRVGTPLGGIYSASKAAVIGLSQAMAGQPDLSSRAAAKVSFNGATTVASR